MTDHIEQRLLKIPAVKGKSVMTLADIIGAQNTKDIENSGKISFHSTGDTGRGADSPQGQVADAMTKDFDIAAPAASPAFFLHLGDVIYGSWKDQAYKREFYEPYVHYPGKIIAIPGNHDGETFATTDPQTLRAFLANFCAASAQVPAVAGTIFRETMTQPGVYWFLDAPFVDIVGLYSNVAENPGFISGKIPGQAQKKWLGQMLSGVAAERKKGARKALVLAVHHPPFSSAGHSGSPEMLADIDAECKRTGVMPDVVLSAHSHTYQRFTRHLSFGGQNLAIPYIVCGIGGINDKDVPPASGGVVGDHTFEKSHRGFGYLLVQVTAHQVTIVAMGVDGAATAEFDRVTVAI